MAHKETLNKHKVEILKRMADHVMTTHRNEVPLSILRDNVNHYNNAQKLRLHALIFKVKRGTWGITSHGWRFLRGVQDLPRFVLVEDNRITLRSSELVNIRHVFQGSTVIHTTFEYFDATGKPVGVRPLDVPRPTLKQEALL